MNSFTPTGRIAEAFACFWLGVRQSLTLRAIATLSLLWLLALVFWMIVFVVYRNEAVEMTRAGIVALAKGIWALFPGSHDATTSQGSANVATNVGSVLANYSSSALSWMLVVVAYVLAVLVSVRVACELILMRWIRQQAAPLYPSLKLERPSQIAGNRGLAFRNFIYPWVGLLVITPAMLLVPLVGGVAMFAILSYLNIRFLINDATDGMASAFEVREFINARRGEMILLGLLVTLLNFVPLVGFIIPWTTGSAACHLALRYFAERQSQAISK